MEPTKNADQEALAVQLETLANLLYLARHHPSEELSYIEWADEVVQELIRNPALKTGA